MEIRYINNELREDVVEFIQRSWGSAIIVVGGRVHNMDRLPGFIAYNDKEEIIGLVTYSINHGECEIVSLDSLQENKGIGTILLERVYETAEKEKCSRVWLITTNDNTRAIRFYQKRGFDMRGFYPNAVNEARKIKPQIPKYGYDGIEIKHEIEFEKRI